MTTFNLPSEVEAVFRLFPHCEFATLGKDGTPIAWPMDPLYLPETKRLLVTTSIGLPQKAFNVRRNPHVSLLFSDPTGSGLSHPPAVLVQGNANIPHEVATWDEDLERFWSRIYQSRPASSNVAMLSSMDWFYMRLLIYVTPQRIRWWPKGDFEQIAQEIEVSHVG